MGISFGAEFLLQYAARVIASLGGSARLKLDGPMQAPRFTVHKNERSQSKEIMPNGGITPQTSRTTTSSVLST